jgi:hypothetical protein
MPSGNSHGGRRRGAGRPRGALGRRGGVLHMSLASLARKYTEDAITTLATIMEDKGEPASARIRAATKLLNRGYGPPAAVHRGADALLGDTRVPDPGRNLRRGEAARFASSPRAGCRGNGKGGSR